MRPQWSACSPLIPMTPRQWHSTASLLSSSVDLNVRNYDQQLKAGKVLEALLARQPDHPGGLHYLIHAYDFAPLAERGLAAARRYAAAAPASYHARHMPAHIFTMLGLWEESIRANRDSNAVIDPDRANDAVGGDIAGLHAFDFIAYARLQLAQDRWVAADLEAMRKARRPATLMNARYVLERGDWQAAADFPLAGDGGFDDVTARFARALGAARLGQAKRARDRTELAAGIAQHHRAIERSLLGGPCRYLCSGRRRLDRKGGRSPGRRTEANIRGRRA